MNLSLSLEFKRRFRNYIIAAKYKLLYILLQKYRQRLRFAKFHKEKETVHIPAEDQRSPLYITRKIIKVIKPEEKEKE